MEPSRRGRWGVLLCLFAGACSQRSSPPPFTITHTSPALGPNEAPLLLNDAITIYFSSPVLPVSVTGDSVTLIDELGQRVPGQLRVGGNWITFTPAPPLSPELDDGSYRLGGTYRLLVLGSPCFDAVRAVDDRRLATVGSFDVRVARLDEKPVGWPAPLRPIASDLPFVLRCSDLPELIPADAPRLRLHFTQPLLPASVVPEAFVVTLLAAASPPVRLLPRRARVVTSRLDDHPGCTVELDLGALPRRADGRESAALQKDEVISVALAGGEASVSDYAGNAPLPTLAPPQWIVVAGSHLPLVEWPAGDMGLRPEGDLMPSFEARGGVLRPAVRVEAGNGSLGVFRPRTDTVLRPGQPFDRGDGQVVVSRGGEFPFQAIDIPVGILVHVAAGETPVRLLSCGSIRVAGTLELDAAPQPVPPRRLSVAVSALAEAVSVAVIAAGDVEITGVVRARTPATDATTNLLLASAGILHLRGEMPFHTLLAVETGRAETDATIRGTRGQSLVYFATFTYGLADGAEFPVRGLTPWRSMPLDRDGGVVRLDDRGRDLQVAFQTAPADPVRKNEPDLGIGRVGRLQPVVDGDTIAVAPGAYVRFALSAHVRSDEPLPRLRELRLVDR